MRRQRPGHRIWSFRHRGLLLLAAAVAVMLFFLYGLSLIHISEE